MLMDGSQPDPSPESLGRSTITSRCGMGIHVESGRRPHMAEPRSNDRNRNSGVKYLGGHEMPQTWSRK
jgi:hypothetical protein